MSLRRQRAVFVSGLALLAASGAACSAVLGLDPPTLAACAEGCPEASVPVVDAAPDVVADVVPDVGVDAVPDALPDALPDATSDGASPVGVRCGGGSAPTIYCVDPSPMCCLTLDDAGSASYACVGSATDCSGYPIACASDNDCAGSDVCCFYNSGIKCESDTTASCTKLVCNAGDPASDDECNAGQTCTPDVYSENGYPLPYDGCM